MYVVNINIYIYLKNGSIVTSVVFRGRWAPGLEH